jgi:hypothetical protein
MFKKISNYNIYMPRDHKSKCAQSPKSESSDSSSSSSESEVDVQVFVKNNKNKKSSDRKHKKRSESCSSEESRRSRDKPRKRSESSESRRSRSNSRDRRSSSSESECDKKKFCFDEIYNYYKWKLIKDDTLMAGGSNAYIAANNQTDVSISQNDAVNFSNVSIARNIEHPEFNSPFVVRESGVYLLFFVGHVEQSAQFSVFINGVYEPSTTSGNNAGAGQSILRQLLKLNKDDTIIIRNYTSNASSLTTDLYTGGKQEGNNFTLLLVKVSVLPCEEHRKPWDQECLSRRKLFLYKKILEKMLMDKDLMLKGFNVHGSFYSKAIQVVPNESNVVYDQYINVNGLTWNAANPDRINILEDGIYKVFFVASTSTAAQISFAVNDVPVEPSVQGTNKGAGQLSIRIILELKKGDYLTVKNHTSNNSVITLTEKAGGHLQALTAITTIFKIAPLPVVYMPPKMNRHCEKNYEKFRGFLLNNKHLQIAGSTAYFNYITTYGQTVPSGSEFSWEVTSLQEDIWHRQSTTELVIKQDGIYDLFVDIITQEPCQLALFVNGIPDLETVSGRDSGANRTILRQFVRLNKGDSLTVRNYDSLSGTVHTSHNNGGFEVGHPALFMGFMLTPTDDCLPQPPCSPKCHKKR